MRPPLTTKIKAGFLVGTLDITGAFLNYCIRTGKSPLNVLNYISSSVLGDKAFSGQAIMPVLGLLIHYCIAFLFTFFFFLIFPVLKKLFGATAIIAIVYGLFIWAFMEFIALPLTLLKRGAFNPTTQIIGSIILIICIGIPLSLIASKYYKNRKKEIVM